MEKDYIDVNRNTYNELAKEYKTRNYAIQDDYYINTLFKDLDFKKGKSILEIGPGRGDRLKNFCDYGLDVTAIELSEGMSELSKARAPKAKVINNNVFDCKLDTKFDFVYMEAVIHNFPIEEARKLLKIIRDWLKDDGILICTTTIEKIDRESFEEKADYQSKRQRFRHRFTEESFETLFKDAGFEIIDKKFKEEKDEKRVKMWQILYMRKK